MPATQMVTLETPEGSMGLYEAKPNGEARHALVVIQEAFGVNDHIQDVTRRFADAGYHAVAPELFHRSGGGSVDYGDFSKVLPKFEGLSDAALLVDVDAALDHLTQAGFEPDRIGIVGFCMGGRVTFLVAVERALGAAVGFYGGGIVTGRFPQFPALVDRVAELKTPWLGLFGDLDEGIPVDDVEQLRATLDRDAKVDHQIVRYPNAGHGFHCDARPSYEPDSARDGWTRALGWLEQHLA